MHAKQALVAFGLLESSPLQPTVWRIPLPTTIQNQLISDQNKDGTLTINDLEMAGVLLQWLALEIITPTSLKHKHVAIYCDNSSTVSWANKLTSTSSPIAAHLLRALALRQHLHQTSPLLVSPIAGYINSLADAASRSFLTKTFTNSQKPFVQTFNNLFPLKQNNYWKELKLPTNWTSRVMSCLLGKPLTMALWIQIPNQDKNIGLIGQSTVPNFNVTHSYHHAHKSNKISLSQRLLPESVQATTAEAAKSKYSQFQKRYQPSPRPWSWLDNPRQSIKQQTITPHQWHGQLKGGEDKTHPPSPN